MNKKEYELLSSSEVTYLLVGLLIGMGALALPNDVMATAKQDGWISVLLGAVYPLLIMFLSVYILKNNPGVNILSISRNFFGKTIGNILNLLFAFQFAFYCTAVTAGCSNILRLYVVSFLEPIKIFILIFVIAAYASSRGLKVVARVNEIVFYLTVLIVILPIMALKDGSVLNISPILGSGIKNIILGTKETIFAYASSEAILLIPLFIRDKNKIKSSFFKAIVYTALIYTWITFITIYYLGPDIIPKSLWGFISVTDSVKVPVINNFRFIFMYLWTIIILKTITNEYYFITFVLSDVTKIKRKIVNICIFPLLLYFTTLFGNEAQRRKIIAAVVVKLTLFNIIFIVLIALIIFVKKVMKDEKNSI